MQNSLYRITAYAYISSLEVCLKDLIVTYIGNDSLKDEKINCFISRRLIKRVSSKQIVAYKNDIEKLDKQNIEQFNILEFYYRVRLIIDYISGMTDDFALEEYQILSAIK